MHRMLLASVGAVAGLVLLSYAADQFVTGAARLATVLRISGVVVGAVVIGFGTSAPELLVSGLAAHRGALDLAVGNIIGSNVANLTLVLGVAAIVTPIVARAGVLRREAPLSFVAVLVFALLVQGGLAWWQGLVLATIMAGSLGVIIWTARSNSVDLDAQVEEFVATRYPSTRRETMRTIIGLVGTIAGAKLLVDSAQVIAAGLGVGEGFIGLTVVAVGTSLPELATAIHAARHNETDLVIGNLLGSNLFNVGAVGATVAFVGPGRVDDPVVIGLATVLMCVVTLVAWVFIATGSRVVRWEGVVLLVAYLAALPFLAG